MLAVFSFFEDEKDRVKHELDEPVMMMMMMTSEGEMAQCRDLKCLQNKTHTQL